MTSRVAAAWTVVRDALRPRTRGIAAEVVSLSGVVVVCAGVATWSTGLALIVAGGAIVHVGLGIER